MCLWHPFGHVKTRAQATYLGAMAEDVSDLMRLLLTLAVDGK